MTFAVDWALKKPIIDQSICFHSSSSTAFLRSLSGQEVAQPYQFRMQWKFLIFIVDCVLSRSVTGREVGQPYFRKQLKFLIFIVPMREGVMETHHQPLRFSRSVFFVDRSDGDACPPHVCCRSPQGRQVAVEPVPQWGGPPAMLPV